MNYIPILSTLVTFIFAGAVFRRYQRKRGTHLLLWGIGLVLYGLGTFTEVVLGFTYSELGIKVWYLSGAMLTAAWLGQGTIHLLVRKRNVAPTLTVILALASLVSIYLVLSAPVTAAVSSFDVSQPISVQYKEILTRSGPTILLTILLNLYGTLGLVGGALYSAYLFWRKRVLANRLMGNILIAAGALMPATAGTFVQAGLVDWLYISELLGAILMFAGFIQATASKPAEVKSTTAATVSN